MRTRKRILLLAILAVALAGNFVVWISRPALDEFVGRDLRKLAEEPEPKWKELLAKVIPSKYINSKSRLDRLLDSILPKEEFRSDPVWRGFGGLEPWYLWRLDDSPGRRFILFQANTLFPVPGSARIIVHFVSSTGKHVACSDFHVGGRTQLVDAVLVRHEFLDTELIEIRTRQTLGGYDSRQFYALNHHRVALVRIQSLDGELIANSYYSRSGSDYPRPGIGPTPPARSADEWEELLMSGRACDILEALIWIGGDHSWNEGQSRHLIDVARSPSSIQGRISDLSLSDNTWIRDAAKDTIRELKLKG